MLERYMKKKELKDYYCYWCKNKFQQLVGMALGKGSDGGQGKKRKISSQVKCPKCGNFIKTW